jgi:mono/diheme cytochrome c family protein
MSRIWKPLTSGRRLLVLALILAAPAATSAQQPKPEELAAQAKTILTKYCFECHGKDPAKIKKKLNILDHAALLADKRKLLVPKAPDDSKIIKRIENADEPMPPEGKPQVTEAERKVLRAWIAAGAPAFVDKTAAQTTAPPPAPQRTQPKDADLAAKAQAVLTKSCFACHGKDPKKVRGKLKVLDMASLLDKKREPVAVVPKSPDDSALIQRVESRGDDVMPPEGKPKLSDADRKILRDWVAAGAQAFPEKTAEASAPPPTNTPPEDKTPVKTETKTDVRVPNLDAALLEQAPQLLAALREKGYKNIGVLKFRVLHEGENDEEVAGDNVGPLNQMLATRLEMALALADDDKEPIGIVRDASAVAAFTKGNHRVAGGQAALFGPKYPLAWGETLVKPDAFVTGGVKMSSNLRYMMVQLLILGKDADSVKRQDEPFLVTCDPDLLIAAGESFLIRDALKEKDALSPARAIKAATDIRDEQVPSPVIDRGAPINLEVQYDGKVVPVEYREGRFHVPEPKEGQKVSFVVKRQGAANERLALVLKINGSNTLFRERFPDGECRKWVLEPGTDSLTVNHFQTEAKGDAGEIQVQAVAKSKAGEVRYSRDVGTISLTVYREAADKQAAARGEGASDEAALARGDFAKDKPADLSGLKQQLHKDAAPENAVRALDAPTAAGAATQPTEFRADPTPVMALTVACYRR